MISIDLLVLDPRCQIRQAKKRTNRSTITETLFKMKKNVLQSKEHIILLKIVPCKGGFSVCQVSRTD